MKIIVTVKTINQNVLHSKSKISIRFRLLFRRTWSTAISKRIVIVVWHGRQWKSSDESITTLGWIQSDGWRTIWSIWSSIWFSTSAIIDARSSGITARQWSYDVSSKWSCDSCFESKWRCELLTIMSFEYSMNIFHFFSICFLFRLIRWPLQSLYLHYSVCVSCLSFLTSSSCRNALVLLMTILFL